MEQGNFDIFSIYYPPKDMAVLFHGPLDEARKKLWKKRRGTRKMEKTVLGGVESEYEIKLNRRKLKWMLTMGGKLIQRTYPQWGGYYLITKSYNGHIVSKSTYKKKHIWQKTAYFEQGNTAKPVAVFSPMENADTLKLLEYRRSDHMYAEFVLHPFTVELGTENNSYLNAQLGEPELYASTSKGDFGFYRDAEKVQKRKELLDKLEIGEISAEPVWQKEPMFMDSWKEEEESLDIGEGYSYKGETDENGERHGRGRTENKNGFTAYEGGYAYGKRSGKGAYYYEDGSFCYYGGWKKGKRSGLGFTVKKDSGSIHVGNWDGGVLSGASAVFGEDGYLKNFGTVENGEAKGLKVHFAPDGKIILGNWEGNTLTGAGSIYSAEGKLLYCGGLKEGKREGEGTSFKENGSIEFAGEWKNDNCHVRYIGEE